jgi:hypothetical protein
MSAELLAAAVTAAVLVGGVALRTLTNGRIEIRLNDAIIAAIAAGLTLFMSGKISKLAVGTEGLTVETAKEAIIAAAKVPIDRQVTALPVAPLEFAEKGGADVLQTMVRRGTPALEFRLGRGGYYAGGAVREYLETLTRQPAFRFVVFFDSDGKLFGMIDGRKLLAELQSRGSDQGFSAFAQQVNRASPEDRIALTRLAGFVPASAAVARQADKRDVLDKMETLNADWLPVIGANDRFEGIVDRSRVTAKLILDVTDRLKAEAPLR